MEGFENPAHSSISKLQACLLQIEAALLLMMRDYNPVSAHTLLSASKGILRGIHIDRPNTVLLRQEAAISRRVKPEFQALWRKNERRPANFFKHADRDANDTLSDFNLKVINTVEAVICILAIWEYLPGLPKSILIGLIHITKDTGHFLIFMDILGKQLTVEKYLTTSAA
jgi:hypothetical protein